MGFFVIGLFVSLGFDSWGEQALEAAVEAFDYETAIAWGASEAGVAGAMLLAGLFLLLAGAGGLQTAFNALGNKKEGEGLFTTLWRLLPRLVTKKD